MKFLDPVNPAHAASKDKTRYVLEGVLIKDDLAVATNGRILFAAKIHRDDDDSKRDAVVPVKAIHTASKGKTGKRGRGKILPLLTIKEREKQTDRQTVEVMHGQEEVTRFADLSVEPHSYPKVSNIFTDPSKHTMRLGISIALLTKLAKAFGEDMVQLSFDPEMFSNTDKGYSGAIYVTSSHRFHNDHSVGIIMPATADHQVAKNEVVRKMWAEQQAGREAKAAEAKSATEGGES